MPATRTSPATLCLLAVLGAVLCGFWGARVAAQQDERGDFYPQWRAVAVPQLPPGRSSPACARGPLNGRDVIACFGGRRRTPFEDGEVPPGFVYPVVGHAVISYDQNDVNLFDVQDRVWSVDVAGNTLPGGLYSPVYGSEEEEGFPYGRSQATAVMHQQKLVVFGGINHKRLLPGDGMLAVFDFDTSTWDVDLPYDPLTDPSPRHGHTAVEHNGVMYVFGGYWPIPKPPLVVGDQAVPYLPDFFHQLWALDLATYEWTCVGPSEACGGPANGAVWPSARAFHSAVVRGGSMYVWGGTHYNPACLSLSVCESYAYETVNELWRYDFSDGAWHDLSDYTPGPDGSTPPPPREYHAAAVSYNQTYMLIFGGLSFGGYLNDIHKYHFDDHRWEEVGVSYPAAPPLYGHALFALDKAALGSVGDIFLVTCGRRFDDQDIATSGELYVGPEILIPPEPEVPLGSSKTVVVAFERKSPTQKMIPIDDCGKQVDEAAVTVTFVSATERTPTGTLVQQVDFVKSTYTINIANVTGPNPEVGFNLTSNDELDVEFGFTLYTELANISYADTNFIIEPNTNKWTFSLSRWQFLSPANSFIVQIGLSLPGNTKFDDFSTVAIPSSKQVRYMFRSKDVSMFVMASDVAIIDGVVTPIQHTAQIPSDGRPVVRFIFPQFSQGILYDPDFGVFLQKGKASGDCAAEDEGLADWEIAIIVLTLVIPALMALVAGGTAAFLWFKRRRVPLKTLEMVEFDAKDANPGSASDCSDDDLL